jgi:hypothetical protein
VYFFYIYSADGFSRSLSRATLGKKLFIKNLLFNRGCAWDGWCMCVYVMVAVVRWWSIPCWTFWDELMEKFIKFIFIEISNL